MGKRRETSVRRSAVLEPAGIDIGAEEIYVAVPPDRDEQATRRFTAVYLGPDNARWSVVGHQCSITQKITHHLT
jgi:hypothetical protein